MANLDDTPEGMVSRLDAGLTRRGETVTIKRTGVADVACRAVVRGIKAEELVGTAVLSDLMVVISPSGFDVFGLPRATDVVFVKGKKRQVKFVDPIYVNDIWVRCNMVVAG
jgi:hypothetical protein